MTEIEPGRYICLKTGSPLGFLVRLFTRSPLDHTIIVTGPDRIVQATVWGVKDGSLSQFAGALAVANLNEPLPPWQLAEIVAYVESRVGNEYAFPQIVVIGLRKLGIKWKWLLKVSADNDAEFCSELAVLGGQKAGLDWLCGESEPGLVTPAELGSRPCCVPIVIGKG